MSNRAALSGPDRIVFETPLVSAGEFRCPVGDRRFEDSGPTRQYCFVFPRNACWIEQQGSREFVADSTVVPLYNQGHPYRRGAISPDGDRTDWFAVAPPVLREMVSALDPRRADEYDHLFPIPYVPATAATFLAQRYVFHHLHSEGPPDPLYVEEAVLTTLTDVLERAFGTRDPAESSLTHHRLAQRAREHLNRTYLRRRAWPTSLPRSARRCFTSAASSGVKRGRACMRTAPISACAARWSGFTTEQISSRSRSGPGSSTIAPSPRRSAGRSAHVRPSFAPPSSASPLGLHSPSAVAPRRCRHLGTVGGGAQPPVLQLWSGAA